MSRKGIFKEKEKMCQVWKNKMYYTRHLFNVSVTFNVQLNATKIKDPVNEGEFALIQATVVSVFLFSLYLFFLSSSFPSVRKITLL